MTTPTFTVAPFRPAWWLPGGHLQTLAGKYLRRPGPFPFIRERIDTPDGDFLDLDFGPDPDPTHPLVLLLHGLEGFTQRPYMMQAALALKRRGMATVGLNFRSCSGEPNLLPRLYHSGETQDASTWSCSCSGAAGPGDPLVPSGSPWGGTSSEAHGGTGGRGHRALAGGGGDLGALRPGRGSPCTWNKELSVGSTPGTSSNP